MFMKNFFKQHWLIILSFIYLIYPFDFIADIFGPVGLIDYGIVLFTVIVRELYLAAKKKKQNG